MGVTACIRWCCGRGDVARFRDSFSVMSFFGIDNGFSFSRGDIVSGCLSLRYGGVGWARALSFMDVFWFWPMFQIRVYTLDVLLLLGRSVDGGGELLYSFP